MFFIWPVIQILCIPHDSAYSQFTYNFIPHTTKTSQIPRILSIHMYIRFHSALTLYNLIPGILTYVISYTHIGRRRPNESQYLELHYFLRQLLKDTISKFKVWLTKTNHEKLFYSSSLTRTTSPYSDYLRSKFLFWQNQIYIWNQHRALFRENLEEKIRGKKSQTSVPLKGQ